MAVIKCRDCGVKLGSRETITSRDYLKRCRPCLRKHENAATKERISRFTEERKSAIKLTNEAIRKGALLSLRLNRIKCTDCNNRATMYDHRDYSKPLDVEPVCGSCNNRRGSGLFAFSECYAAKKRA